MSDSFTLETLDADLRGLRIGLSGAIPEPGEWDGHALDWEILNAVTTLADTVFSGGGHLVHGSHPSFTPRILAQAAPYAEERGEPVATFVLSGLFAESPLARLLHDPRYLDKVLRLIVVPPVVPAGHEGHGAEDAAVRNASLTAMRERLIQEMDAMVIIGGKRWTGSEHTPGTVEELKLARDKGIPVFPLGGLGGMAKQLAEDPGNPAFAGAAEAKSAQPLGAAATDTALRAMRAPGHDQITEAFADTLAAVRPPLQADDAALVRSSRDYGRAIGIIARHLGSDGRR